MPPSTGNQHDSMYVTETRVSLVQRHGSVWYRDMGQSGTETRVSLVQRHGSVWYRDTGQSGTETRVSLVQRHRSVWYRDTGQSGTDQDTNKMRVVSPHLMSAAMRGTVKFSPSTILSCRIRNPPHSPNRFTMSSNQPCKEQVMSPPCTLILAIGRVKPNMVGHSLCTGHEKQMILTPVYTCKLKPAGTMCIAYISSLPRQHCDLCNNTVGALNLHLTLHCDPTWPMDELFLHSAALKSHLTSQDMFFFQSISINLQFQFFGG